MFPGRKGEVAEKVMRAIKENEMYIWTVLKTWSIGSISDSIGLDGIWSKNMRGQPGFFDIDDRLKRLSDLGDQLEAFRSAVDFELFRPELSAALSYYTDRTEGGRPPFDPVLMFKILVIQATNNLSDERAEFSSMTGCRLCGNEWPRREAGPSVLVVVAG